ncbi:hypothetical protein HWV62_22744 [Athelia sp. TMB]|nr:hypothetical protein HWV62_22744 [Athelia sp. TMB]
MHGSIAAGVQSAIYGGFTTGVFSALQAFTMGTVGVPIAMTVAGSTSLVIAAVLTFFSFWRPGSDSGQSASESGNSPDDGKDKKE